MRSLRSTRKTAEFSNCKPARGAKQDENSNVKVCKKQQKPGGKIEARSRRPVLADKTNSGSDLNSSPSTSATEISTKMTIYRPKRTPCVPAKFKDHVMSPVSSSQTIIPDFSSTPLIKAKSARIPPSRLTPKGALVSKSVSRKPIEIPEISPVKTTRANTRSRVANKVSNPAVTVYDEPGKKSIVQICEISEEKTVCDKPAKINSAEIKITKKTETPLFAKSPAKPNTPHKVQNQEIKHYMTPIYKKKMIQLEKHTIPTPDRAALYEFDFDPSEEPSKPKKKKVVRKPGTRRKKAKPAVTDGDAALQDLILQLKKIQETQKIKNLLKKKKAQKAAHNIIVKPTEPVIQTIRQGDGDRLVQDLSAPHLDNGAPSPISKPRFCYSPRPSSPMDNYDDDVEPPAENSNSSSNIADIRSMSCFSDMPAASSSMIQGSAHKPAPSPWRVNYDNEIRKWPCNFYVKASMTPSYERDTFHVIGLDNNTNKTDHNNTNNVPERPTKYVDDSQKLANWKQTSILSFYEESMKKTAKKRCHPSKNSKEPYNFDELNPPSPLKDSSIEEVVPVQVAPEKIPPKVVEIENPNVDNCFGFDDSAEFDQENVSPVKKPKLPNINTVRGGTKSLKNRGILKEINLAVNLPTRATVSKVLKVIAKNKVIEDLDEIVEAPLVVEKVIEPVIESLAKDDSDGDSSNMEDNTTATDSVETSQASLENEMALFEDPLDANEPKLVHFNKVSRLNDFFY